MQGRRVGGGGNRALRNSFDATTLFAPSLSIKATFDILKFSIIASLGGHKQRKWINLFIHFLCFCPLRLTIMLNFNVSKVAYSLVYQSTWKPGSILRPHYVSSLFSHLWAKILQWYHSNNTSLAVLSHGAI